MRKRRAWSTGGAVLMYLSFVPSRIKYYYIKIAKTETASTHTATPRSKTLRNISSLRLCLPARQQEWIFDFLLVAPFILSQMLF
jgi:hypothetical protein